MSTAPADEEGVMMGEDPSTFSDFIIYVDESGDHGMAKHSPEFAVFVLTFCVFRKDDYIDKVVPALQRIKFKHFGHDMVVFHEREIRKASGPFGFLTNAARRDEFMKALNEWVERSPFGIIAVVIRKDEFAKRHTEGQNPYHFAMGIGLVCVDEYLRRFEPPDRQTHIVFEARGKTTS